MNDHKQGFVLNLIPSDEHILIYELCFKEDRSIQHKYIDKWILTTLLPVRSSFKNESETFY